MLQKLLEINIKNYTHPEDRDLFLQCVHVPENSTFHCKSYMYSPESANDSDQNAVGNLHLSK